MHIAGQIYSQGILNAEKGAVSCLVKGIDNIHKVTALGYPSNSKEGNRQQGRVFWNQASRFESECPSLPEISANLDWANGRPDYHHLGHFSLAHNSHDRWLLVLGYQAIRIAAMVHDLGHPPFSHVMEYALTDVLKEEFKCPSEQMKRVSALREAENRDLHEILTSVLFCELATELRGSLNDAVDITSPELFFCCQALELAKLLLFSKEKAAHGEKAACVCIAPDGEVDRAVFDREVLLATYRTEESLALSENAVQCLHDIKAAEHIDADRLDYVVRDLLQAGLKSQGMRMGRLLQTFRLVNCTDGIHFLPSATALRSIEEFFSERLELYRAVIYHHHVVKTDLLLQLCIKTLLKDSKDDPVPETSLKTIGSINLAWQLFSLSASDANSQILGSLVRQRIYPFFDDGWLFGILQHRHFELHGIKKQERTPDQRMLLARLEELLSGKKIYLSLIKRLQDIGDVWQGYAEGLTAEATQLVTKIDAVLAQGRPEVEVNVLTKWKQVKSFLIKIQTSEPNSLSQSYNLYNAENVELLEQFLKADITSAANSLANENDALDALATLRKDKAQVPDFDLATNDATVVKFSDLSHSVTGLQEASRSMPRIFVYFAKKSDNGTLSAIELVDLRKRFGTLLANKQCERVEKLLMAQQRSAASSLTS